MNKLSSKQIENIEKAVNRATDLVFDESLSPSEAIAKTASAMKLSSDYIPIIIHAFNNGAAEVHRKEASCLKDKVADFPIAKQDEVYRFLGDKLPEKKAAATVTDTFYDIPLSKSCPDAWSHLDKYKYRGAGGFNEAAPVIKQAFDRTADYTDSINDLAKKAADEAMCIKYAAEDAVSDAYCALEEELLKYDGVSIKSARMHAEAAHGDFGVDIVNEIIDGNDLEKKANIRRDMLISDTHPFAVKLKDFVFKSELMKEAQAQEIEVLEKCAEAMIDRLPEKAKPIAGEQAIDEMFKEGTLKRKKKERQRKLRKCGSANATVKFDDSVVNPITGTAGLETLLHPTWSGLDPYERYLMNSLSSPTQTAKLRNIRTQSMMLDLLNTDPYLKEKNPEEVLEAANDLIEVNKDLHNNKPALRVALRQYMESGGLDLPTLGTISDYGSKQKAIEQGYKTKRDDQIVSTIKERDKLIAGLNKAQKGN